MTMLNGNIIGAKRHNVRGVNELYDIHIPINYELTHIANTTGFGTTIALTLSHPAGVQAGDLCVLYHQGFDDDSDYLTTAPSNFTIIDIQAINYSGTNWQSQVISYRVLQDITNVTLPTGNGSTQALDNQAYTAIYFRVKSPATITFGGLQSTATTNNPVRRIVTAPTGICSSIVFGSAAIVSGIPSFSEESPAFDATITNTSATNIETIIGYKIYNLGFLTHNIDMLDLGENILTSFYIKA